MPDPPYKQTIHLLKPALKTSEQNLFWADQEDHLQEYTPRELLCAFERGEVDGDTRIRIEPSAPSKPLRSYIRELVWMAYQSATLAGENDAEQSRFEAAFERAPIGIVISDLTGLIQHANTAFSVMIGYSEDELIGMRVGSISETKDRLREITLGNEVLAGIRSSFEIEKCFRHRDGSQVETLLSIAMIQKADGTPHQIVAHVLDLTRRKRLERELAQAERLKSIGKLAGGIAHDFNNILQVFSGGIPFLSHGASGERREVLDEMMLAAESGARLTRQIMAFAKQGVVEVEAVELNTLLNNLQPMIQTALGRTSKLVLELAPHPVLISANSMQLEQAIMNLAFNSAKAMKHGGTFTLKTKDFLNDQVALVVRDTGCGMDAETMERAFEPYFSTRKGSGGTGLGLAMVHGIVTRFGGSIALESQPGQGTTCTILWSRHQIASTATLPEPVPTAKATIRTLVVDDELPILRMVSRVLRQAGHTVSTANSVQSAVEISENAAETYELLVCDVCLKDGNGAEVTKAARKRWPDISVLYISGFTGMMMQQRDLTSGEHRFLAKPFRPGDLLEQTEEIIQQRLQSKSSES